MNDLDEIEAKVVAICNDYLTESRNPVLVAGEILDAIRAIKARYEPEIDGTTEISEEDSPQYKALVEAVEYDRAFNRRDDQYDDVRDFTPPYEP